MISPFFVNNIIIVVGNKITVFDCYNFDIIQSKTLDFKCKLEFLIKDNKLILLL